MNRQLVLIVGAGLGRRMGGAKLFLHHQGRGFLAQILARCKESGSPWVLVYPRGKAERVEELLASIGDVTPALAMVEGDGTQPMLGSVQTGLKAAKAAGAFPNAGANPDGCLGCWVWPVDAPGISAQGWREAVATVQAQPDQVWKLQSNGKTGHPSWFPDWAVEIIIQGDWPDGLLGFLAGIKEKIRSIELSGENLRDFNTPQELAQWGVFPG